MNFQIELRKILEGVQGCQAAILMGMDGIAVAEEKSPTVPIAVQDAAIEYSRLLAESIKIAQANAYGPIQEMLITTEKFRFLFRTVTPEYFVGVLLLPEASLGKGRYFLRQVSPVLRTDL